MRFLADLHLHSKYSLATSREMAFPSLAAWAKVKGLSLLGTSDFTHPEWRRLIRRDLEPSGNGFFRLKRKRLPEDARLREFAPGPGEVQFVLSSELSLVYQKEDRTRKIHLLVLTGAWETVEKLVRRLGRRANLRSDGRPVLKMDAADLARMAADIDPECLLVPAHIWTPWFGLFGAKSGFETIEECFEEMTPLIAALETGLSSDPAMTRRISALDRFPLISNSDAHSPGKIGREANAFDTDFSFRGLREALLRPDRTKFLYTVEFFPQEGKYYADGHRKCGLVLSPEAARRRGNICPVCGKKLTMGVGHRIDDLADRPEGRKSPEDIPSRHLVPLEEIIREACGLGPQAASVGRLYFRFIREMGNEHAILTEIPAAELRRIKPERIARGIERVREGRVRITPGYDGLYGRVRIHEKPPRLDNGKS